MQLESAQRAKHSLRVRCNLFLKILLRSLVRNSKAAAGVDVANIVTLFAQPANQIRHAFERLLEGADIGDLRSDVDADSGHFQIRLPRGRCIKRSRLRDRHAELVLMKSGRNIRMRFCRDVGIDPHRDRRWFFQSGRGCRKQIQFRSAFNIEQQYAGAQRKFHFRRSLAHAGEHDLARSLRACAQNSFEFSAGHHVEACSFVGHQAQNCQRRIGFDRIA